MPPLLWTMEAVLHSLQLMGWHQHAKQLPWLDIRTALPLCSVSCRFWMCSKLTHQAQTRAKVRSPFARGISWQVPRHWRQWALCLADPSPCACFATCALWQSLRGSLLSPNPGNTNWGAYSCAGCATWVGMEGLDLSFGAREGALEPW